MSSYFLELPSKKKHPQYYIQIPEPIDLTFMDRAINHGQYTSAEQFDRDLVRLFQNNLRYYGLLSPEGRTALKIRKVYNTIKQEYYQAVADIVGPEGAFVFRKREETSRVEEDVIKCPCGQYKDEGMMIQCEKCQIWQHCDCVGFQGGSDDDEYFCETCGEREPNLDIVLVPQPDYTCPGETYYVTLKRENLPVRLGDTVYVLRAFKNDDKEQQDEVQEKVEALSVVEEEGNKSTKERKEQATTAEVPEEKKPEGEAMEIDDARPKTPIPSTSATGAVPGEDEKDKKAVATAGYNHGGIPHKLMSPLKGPSLEASSLTKGNYPTFKTVDSSITTLDMDIFRIERLWVNEKGERFAFGHHYLRPHETFHEPNRKFFHNEVFRVPIYEVLPLDTIWGQCWVMDIPTYCKGRPLEATEEHVYICEYRVDKSARLFHKISKPKYLTCTKSFAFDFFDEKLKPQRNYAVSFCQQKNIPELNIVVIVLLFSFSLMRFPRNGRPAIHLGQGVWKIRITKQDPHQETRERRRHPRQEIPRPEGRAPVVEALCPGNPCPNPDIIHRFSLPDLSSLKIARARRKD